MAKTYAELSQEIETLKTRAEAVRQQEKYGVVARIKEAIAIYGLTAEELGLTGNPGSWGTQQSRPGPGAQNETSPVRKARSAARYRDGAGNSWTGMGPRPRWLNAALAAGRSLESLTANDHGIATGFAFVGDPATQSPRAQPKPLKKLKLPAKYKDDSGRAWTGRGPMPRWLKEAVAGGKTLEQMAA